MTDCDLNLSFEGWLDTKYWPHTVFHVAPDGLRVDSSRDFPLAYDNDFTVRRGDVTAISVRRGYVFTRIRVDQDNPALPARVKFISPDPQPVLEALRFHDYEVEFVGDSWGRRLERWLVPRVSRLVRWAGGS